MDYHKQTLEYITNIEQKQTRTQAIDLLLTLHERIITPIKQKHSNLEETMKKLEHGYKTIYESITNKYQHIRPPGW